jgi:hypothetical protein
LLINLKTSQFIEFGNGDFFGILFLLDGIVIFQSVILLSFESKLKAQVALKCEDALTF